MSNDNACIVRRSRMVQRAKSTGCRRHSCFASQRKILTRTSILIVSICYSVNWMLADGASFSSSVPSPSLAPTSLVVNDGTKKPKQKDEWPITTSSSRPSSSPTSSAPSQSKKMKKHKKDKTLSGVGPRSTVDLEMGSDPKKLNPKARKSADRDSTTPAAFGLKGAHASSRIHSKRKGLKSSVPSTSKTAKTTAFVRDKSNGRRKHTTSDFKNNSVSNMIADKEGKRSKISKGGSRNSTKNSLANLGTLPNAVNNNAERGRRVSSAKTKQPRATLTRKSSKYSRVKHFESNLSSVDNANNSDDYRVKKEKFQKKHKQRTKNANIGSEVLSAIEGTQLEQKTMQTNSVANSIPVPEAIGDSSNDKAPKRKGRKRKIPSSTAVGVEVTSSISDSSKDIPTIETSTYNESDQTATETIEGSKSSKKKRRRKIISKVDKVGSSSSNEKEKSISATTTTTKQQLPTIGGEKVELALTPKKLDENDILESKKTLSPEHVSQSMQNNGKLLPQVAIDMIDATEEESGATTKCSDRDSSLAVKVEDKGKSTDASQCPSEISVDNLAGTEDEAEKSNGEITSLISSSPTVEEVDGNFKEGTEKDLEDNREDRTESKEESLDTNANDESEGTIDNQEKGAHIEEVSEGLEKNSPQNDAKELDEDSVSKQESVEEESMVAVEDKEKGTEIVEKESSHLIADESIAKEKNRDNDRDENQGTAGDKQDGAEEEIPQVDVEKDNEIPEAENNVDEESEDMTEPEEEKTEIVGIESSQVDEAIDDTIVEERVGDEKNEDLIKHKEEKTEIAEMEFSPVNTSACDSFTDETNVDEEMNNSNELEDEGIAIIEEKAMQMDEEIVLDKSITEKENANEKSDDVTEIVEEKLPKVDLDATEIESITEEMDGNEETQVISESEDHENQSTSHQSSDEAYDIDAETRRGVLLHNDPDQEISSSEESDFDPEQDVVSFIEDVLHENVRSWIEESDSHFETIVNKTRGGNSYDTKNEDSKASDSRVLQDGDKTKQNTDDEVLKTPDTSGDECRADSPNPIDLVEEKCGIIGGESLEKLEDKQSDAVVSVVTWNLAEDSPSEEDAAFIRKFRKNGISQDQGSDIVLISGQECENIKPRRSEGRRSREYRRLMIKMLGKDYVPLTLHLLGGIQFGLFAKKSFLKEIEDVSVADVTCGIGNVFHNKGAIAAFVKVKARNDTNNNKDKKRSKSLRMIFVTAHLAAHVKNAEARNSDFWRISSELEAQAPDGFLPRKVSHGEPSGSFLFDSVDRVFFCGDLNYRLDLPRELTEHTILQGASHEKASIKDLLRHDQLIHSMAEGRAFPGFGEGKITFVPTFKYDKESSSYDTSHKQRIPAWTDRILFQPTDGIRVLDYQSISGAQSSDHRPIYGTYRIGMQGRVITPSLRKTKRKRINETFDRSDEF